MRCASLAGLLALMALLAPARAGACTIGATGVNFGNYDPRDPGPTDGAGYIFLSCHPRTRKPEIELGTGGSGSYSPRGMKNGASDLGYNLYTDAARVFVWGDGSNGTITVTESGGIVFGGDRYFLSTVYGRIPAGQTQVTAGTYSDTLFVTIIF